MSRITLTHYGISMKTGFVLEDPLKKLPPYFEPWNAASENMLKLIEEDTLRDEIHRMPVLDFNRLNGEKEVKLAHVQLVFLTSGYLWYKGTEESQVPKVLPKSLAVPLYGLYEVHGIAPVMTYADVCLNNCNIVDSGRTLEVDDLYPILDIPAGQEWRWFFAVSLYAEFVFAASIISLQNLLDGIEDQNQEKITRSLEEIADAVIDIKNALLRMKEGLPLESFVRKFINYFNGYDEPPLKDGLVFEGVKKQPVMFRGPDAGQTPIFQTLDILLGVDHQKEIQDHTQNKLQYVFPQHRQFLHDLRNRPAKLKALVEGSSNLEMKEAYSRVSQTVVQFRSQHIKTVAKYVVLAFNRVLPPDQLEQVKPVKTFIMKYLKGMRDDTEQQSKLSN